MMAATATMRLVTCAPLLLRLVFLLGLYFLYSRVVSFKRLIAVPVSAPAASAAISAEEIVRVFEGLCRRLPLRFSCLIRALALRAELYRAGYHPKLCFGLLPQTGAQTPAHAWLELNGKTLGQQPLDCLDNPFVTDS